MLTRLNALRALAALAVVVQHLQEYFRSVGLNPFPHFEGQWGVDLFFLISGFIIYYTNRNKWGNFQATPFLIRRAWRIYPLYWILTTLMILGMLIYPVFFKTHNLNYWQSFLSYTLIPGEVAPYMMVAWTLTFELFFYFTFAIWMKIFKNRISIGLLIIIFGVICYWWRFQKIQWGWPSLGQDGLLLEFAMGMISAELCLRKKWLPSYILILLPIPLLYFLFPLTCQDFSWRFLGFGLALWPWFQLLMQWDLAPDHDNYGAKISGIWAQHKWIHPLGEASYTLYLVHPILLKIVQSLCLKLIPYFGMIPLLGIQITSLLMGRLSSILAALVLWKWVDLPLQNWAKHRLNGIPKSPA